MVRGKDDDAGEPGWRLSYGDPFQSPPEDRRVDRRLRGRLLAPVTVWTAGEGERRAGLTVSSLLVAEGEPARLLGLLDPLSELHDALETAGRFLVHVLGAGDERLAALFAGRLPADPFAEAAFVEHPFGPRLEGDRHVVCCRLDSSEPAGFQALVRAEIVEVHLAGAAAEPLGWYRGGYRSLT